VRARNLFMMPSVVVRPWDPTANGTV
jgi:hypothetical protein